MPPEDPVRPRPVAPCARSASASAPAWRRPARCSLPVAHERRRSRPRAEQTVAASFSSDLYASPDPQRFSLVLAARDGERHQVRERPAGRRAVQGTRRDLGRRTRKLRLDTEGLPKGRGVYRTDVGVRRGRHWKGQAKIGGERREHVPPDGARRRRRARAGRARAARRVADHDRLARREPDLHARAAVPAAHRVAVRRDRHRQAGRGAVRDARRCAQSQYCGPVLDEMLAIMGPYQDRVTFVHVDIYKSLTGRPTLSPTVEAWKLPSEPWLFGIDGAGHHHRRDSTPRSGRPRWWRCSTA